MEKETTEITQYSVECVPCAQQGIIRKITGYSEDQVLYNLKLHLDAKHPAITKGDRGRTKTAPPSHS